MSEEKTGGTGEGDRQWKRILAGETQAQTGEEDAASPYFSSFFNKAVETRAAKPPTKAKPTDPAPSDGGGNLSAMREAMNRAKKRRGD